MGAKDIYINSLEEVTKDKEQREIDVLLGRMVFCILWRLNQSLIQIKTI